MKKKTVKERENSNQLSGFYSPSRKALIMRDPNSLTAGQRLRRERFLRKLTIEQMSAYLGISTSYLGSIERGDRPVSRKMMDLLHERLNLSYDFMVEGVSISGSMLNQYVKESATYSTHHNLNVLLNVCTKEELDSCYQLVHTFLTHAKEVKSSRSKGTPPSDE